MKKVILFIFIFIISYISAIRINEIEMNPSGTDAGNEWIELYNEGEINLEGYKIVNNDGNEIVLNDSFSGYYIYTFEKQWLDNSDESIFLYKNETLIDKSNLFDDSKNDNKTWQNCDSWEFLEATKGSENRCEVQNNETKEEKPQEIIEDNDDNSDKNNINEDNLPSGEEGGQINTETETPEIIVLSAKDIKSEENTKILDKSEYAKYGFVIFCILIGILLIFKNKKQGNKDEIV